VGSLPLALLGDLLDHADLAGRAASIARAREDLVGVFEPRDFTVHTADAPWVLVQAPGLRESLAPHGVLVRDCTSLGLAGTTRVAVPDAAGLERLAAALDNAGMAAPAGSAGNGASAATLPDRGGRNPAEPVERSLR